MSLFNFLCGVFLGVIILVVTFVIYFKKSYQYWQKKNVPFLKPTLPYGNIADALLGKKNFGVVIKETYDQMKQKGWKYGGLYSITKPNFLPIDLDLFKNIMAKDFHYFTDRNMFCNEKEDPLMANLLTLAGMRWKNSRAKLTPIFTSGKIKMMFETVAQCQINLLKHMEEKSAKGEPIEIKEVLARFTTDAIGSCAFGLDCKSLQSEDTQFRFYGKKFFEITKFREVKRLFTTFFPKAALHLNLYFTPKELTRFFTNVINETVEYRQTHQEVRNDFLQLLIDVKNGGDSLTIEEIAAQCFMFFLGGFETSSTLMTFALYELARHQDIQQKVRDEIEQVLAKHGGKVSYESIRDMKYLSRVIDESARMYPAFPTVSRNCVKDYKVPNENFTIEKGTMVIIPILGIHYDEEYYPEPEKFDPERFTEDNKKSRHRYAYIPFGEGPRSCIAMRFALMEVKVALSCLIRNYHFTVNSKTIEPIEMAPNIVLSAMGEVWLNAKKV